MSPLCYTLKTMLAIILSGGKQYSVREGEELGLEKLKAAVGEKVSLPVLALVDEKAETIQLGYPYLDVKLEAEVMAQGKSSKVMIQKFKSKVRYRRLRGHRQNLTKVKISSVK